MEKNYFQVTNANIVTNSALREPQIEAYMEAYNHFVINKEHTQSYYCIANRVWKIRFDFYFAVWNS